MIEITPKEKLLTGKEGTYVKDFFEIENTNSEPYTISYISTSCGCTTVDNYNNTTIEPNSKLKIEFQINMKEETSKFIWIKGSDDVTHSFTVNRRYV